MHRVLIVLGVIAAGVGFGGCASTTERPHASPPPPTPAEARAVRVHDGRTGDVVPWNALVSAAAGADTVVIGENHGHPLGLAVASALWEDVLGRSEEAALSMEFFERDEQSRVDDYLAGLIDEEAFRKRTGRTATNYPPGHRAMIEAAKAAGRPVYAANAPWESMSLAGREGYERLERLTTEQRRLFRVPDSLPASDSRYRTAYNRVMDQPHGRSGSTPKQETPEEKALRLEKSFRAQSLWDWTMAEAVADACANGNAPVVHVVGRFHSDFRGGLIEALEKLRPGIRMVTISTIDEPSGVLRDEDRERADFVVYVGAESATTGGR